MHSQGAPDVLIIEDIPTPEPGPGEILIKVDAVAVNYADVKRRRGSTYPFPTPLPYILGSEVAGVVAALGPDVAGPPIGTAVFALVGGDGSTGYAQYSVAVAPNVIPIPASVNSDQAAGIVVAGTTAILALTEVAAVAAGETVLVQGAGGGVGGYAVQIAKLLGATVIGAAGTPARREAAVASGADHTVDYTRQGWSAEVRELTAGRGVDVALELGGGEIFDGSLAALAPFGRIVVLGQATDVPLRLDAAATNSFFYDPALNQSLHVFNLGLWFGLRPQQSVAAMQTLIGWVATGQVKVRVGHVLALSEAAEAHRLLEGRQTTGKVILKPWP